MTGYLVLICRVFIWVRRGKITKTVFTVLICNPLIVRKGISTTLLIYRCIFSYVNLRIECGTRFLVEFQLISEFTLWVLTFR